MTGAGAHLSGGRWNSPGRYAIYVSGNLSLAMLELLVHIDDAEKFRSTPHVYHSIVFPDAAVATLAEGDLPDGWDARPEPTTAQVAGDEWLDRHITPVLAVPSVMVPPELRYESSYLNYVINPKHPHFNTAISVGPIHELTWDTRLVRSSR